MQVHLTKSKSQLDAAHFLLDRRSERSAVAIAYFAMFHAATAMGLAEGKTYPACSGWLDAFGEAFATPGKVAPRFYGDLLEAYRLRQIADYGILEPLPPFAAQSTFKKATEFVAMAEEFINGLMKNTSGLSC